MKKRSIIEVGSIRRGSYSLRVSDLMSAQEIDDYINQQDEPKRTTLDVLRRTILEIVPDAEQGMSYGLPAFRSNGRVIAGFGAFKNHLSYVPHSGSTLPALQSELMAYGGTKSSLHFAIDTPLPRELVEKLIRTRLGELDQKKG